MKKFIFLFSFLALASFSGMAQDATYSKALKTYFSASGSQAAFEAVIPQMINMMKAQTPDVSADVWTKIEAEFTKTSMNDLLDMLVPVYKKHMSLEDLNNVIAFYKTPAGKKLSEATPKISAESMAIGQEWGMSIATKIGKIIEENK